MPVHPDDHTLYNALEHIVYEIQTFVDLTFTEMRHPVHVQFAILESWLIHLRSIESMLHRKSKPKGHDILISHYGPIDIKDLVEPSIRDRINGEIAHITTRRMTAGEAKAWDRVEIFRKAWPGIEKIIDVLETWVRSYKPDSRWHKELVATKEHGSKLYAGGSVQVLGFDEYWSEQTDKLNPFVTYTVGYLPKSTPRNLQIRDIYL